MMQNTSPVTESRDTGDRSAEYNSDVTIMIIDDDDIDVRYLTRLIQREGIDNDIVVATDGREALDLMIQKAPISGTWPLILILDINMPRLNGLEFLDIIRADPVLKESIVFMRTTSEQAQDVEAAYAKMIAGYFVKSEKGNEGIMQVLKQYLRTNHFRTKG